MAQRFLGWPGRAAEGRGERVGEKIAALPARNPYIGAAEKNVYLFTPTEIEPDLIVQHCPHSSQIPHLKCRRKTDFMRTLKSQSMISAPAAGQAQANCRHKVI